MTETAPAAELDTAPTYHVVINDEEQYSIWLAEQDVPEGWRLTGASGTKEECLAHIDEVWTDMRPRSLREFMRDNADTVADSVPLDQGPSLVERLCQEGQPVEVVLRPERTSAALRQAVDRGYVFVRFTGTRGGTELGVRLDAAACDLSGADFTAGVGEVELTGSLSLDFEPVRCTARIDLASFAGQGRLERELES